MHRAPGDLSRPDGRTHVAFASTLAARLVGMTGSPLAEAEQAGASWGRELIAADTRGPAGSVATPPAQPGSDAAARRHVVRLLDNLGFAPTADARATDVRLGHCPLLEIAHQHPEVVCAVHLGVVSGVLEALGGDPGRTSLEPFAEPGACRLRLLTSRRR